MCNFKLFESIIGFVYLSEPKFGAFHWKYVSLLLFTDYTSISLYFIDWKNKRYFKYYFLLLR